MQIDSLLYILLIFFKTPCDGRDYEKMLLIVSIFVVVCLFSSRYNPLWGYINSPVAGFSLLMFEVS
jgi:hypothetical protein